MVAGGPRPPVEDEGARKVVPVDRSSIGARPRVIVRRPAGHRAPEGEEETVVADELVAGESVSSSGRHTVPDELVRASTYRLPPDRVFRARVPGSGAPPDDPATPVVPKPRQS